MALWKYFNQTWRYWWRIRNNCKQENITNSKEIYCFYSLMSVYLSVCLSITFFVTNFSATIKRRFKHTLFECAFFNFIVRYFSKTIQLICTKFSKKSRRTEKEHYRRYIYVNFQMVTSILVSDFADLVRF